MSACTHQHEQAPAEQLGSFQSPSRTAKTRSEGGSAETEVNAWQIYEACVKISAKMYSYDV